MLFPTGSAHVDRLVRTVFVKSIPRVGFRIEPCTVGKHAPVMLKVVPLAANGQELVTGCYTVLAVVVPALVPIVPVPFVFTKGPAHFGAVIIPLVRLLVVEPEVLILVHPAPIIEGVQIVAVLNDLVHHHRAVAVIIPVSVVLVVVEAVKRFGICADRQYE